MNKVILDTNAYAALLNGDKDVLTAIGNAGTVFISVFVLGELYYGFRGGSRERENREQLGRFIKKQTVRVIDAGTDTAEYFGQIKDSLKRKGNPVPINDVWIAAHTMEYGAELITYDKHFHKIAGLRVWLRGD